MSARLGTLWYWLSVAVAAVLILSAILWNAWTFNQYRMTQRQIDSLGIDANVAVDEPAAGSPEAAEIDLLLDADRRGILEENFEALLTDPQKRAINRDRRSRLTAKADARRSSLIFGGILILGGIAVYGVGRATRRKA